MFLEFPGPGGMLDSRRSWTPFRGLSTHLLRISRFCFCLLSILLLALGTACGGHHDHSSDPGTPPAITVQPADTATVSGRSVFLSVTATGAPTLRYQWAKDGASIFGALGSSFTLYDPQPKDSGHYTVTITNPNGTLTSSAALLTVVPALEFNAAVSIVTDASGTFYVSDLNDQVIWKVSPSKQVTLLAGSKGVSGSADGQGSAAQFHNPGGLALDPSGNLLVADTGNHTIRRIAPDGTVTTLAGAAGLPGTTDAVGTLARFNAPFGLAVLSTGSTYGGVYISDTQNHTIRFMAPDGTVSTYAGGAGQAGSTNASGTSARFAQPNGLALAQDGTLYVADYGNSCIRMISPNGAQVSTLVGTAGTPGYFDAKGTAALFSEPVGLALDASGNLWVADTYNHAIRRVTPAAVVNAIAGSGLAGNADGTGAAALFNFPCGIMATASGMVVADTKNHILRLVTADGVVTTL